jgi:hypothetical protein
MSGAVEQAETARTSAQSAARAGVSWVLARVITVERAIDRTKSIEPPSNGADPRAVQGS